MLIYDYVVCTPQFTYKNADDKEEYENRNNTSSCSRSTDRSTGDWKMNAILTKLYKL